MQQLTFEQISGHLYDQMNRLMSPDLTPDELEAEIKRSTAVKGIADTVINMADTKLKALKVYDEAYDLNAPKIAELSVESTPKLEAKEK